tara:strand:- start:2869 stop:3078 length:210 start_codon:yes stop_codon:yes gene_type:complete
MKAQLFSLTAHLRQDGNVELNKESVRPEDLEKEMDTGVPDYEGTHSIVSLLRYLNSSADEIINKSAKYV